MKKSYDALISVVITVLALAYPFYCQTARDYAGRAFTVWPYMLVQTAFPIVMALFVILLVRGEEKSLLIHLLFLIVNLALGYYLFWYNSYAMGIFPVYQILAAALLFFDWCAWRLKTDKFN